MKKILLPVICYLLSVNCLAAIPTDYYKSIDGKTGDAICATLFSIISSHTDVGYEGLYDVYPTSDVIPGTNQVWDIYSTCDWKHGSKQCGNYKEVCDCYNREHTVPQSWFGEAKPMVSDAFHVMPTDGKVNGQRSNYPYGECAKGESEGAKALGRLGASTFSGYSGKVFEPVDEYKGDIARNYFYMVTCYRNKNFTQSSEGKVMFSYTGGTAALTDYTIALMLKWHRQDPVSQKEIDRNNAIYAKQHNRNPFIDYPCLAEYIWGENKAQKLDLSAIMSSEHENFLSAEYNSGCNCNTDQPTILMPKTSTTTAIGSASLGDSVSKDIYVQGINLTQSLSCAITGTDAACFSLNKNSITVTDAQEGCFITITYSPTATGSHTATLTISSAEIKTAVTVTLTGESKAELVTPVTGTNIAMVAYGIRDTIRQKVYVKTTNITSNLYIGIASSGTSCFSVKPTLLTAAQANAGDTLLVTYIPNTIGELSTNLIVNSTGKEFQQPTVLLHGACVFQVKEPTDITTSSATLHWVNAGVDNYIVDVFFLAQEKKDSVIILDDAMGQKASATNAKVYSTEDPTAIRLGTGSGGGSITYSNLDLSAGGTVTVRAKTYKSDVTTLQVSIGSAKQSVALTSSYQDYSFDIPTGASSNSTVKFETTKGNNRAYIQHVTIMSGGTKEVRNHLLGYPALTTDLSYQVVGLLPETDYSYTIKPEGLAESDIYTFATAESPTSLESITNHHSPITKMMKEGHLFINNNGRLYNILGTPVE